MLIFDVVLPLIHEVASCPALHDFRLSHPNLEELLDLLNLIVTSHEDAGSVVDVLGRNLEHALHVAVDGLSASYNTSVSYCFP